MDRVLGIIQEVDSASRFADEFARRWTEIHILMLELYSLDIVKVKIHLGHHLAPSWQSHGMAATCFSNERRNRIVISSFSRYKHVRQIEHHALGRHPQATVRRYQTAGLTVPMCLGRRVEVASLIGDERLRHCTSGALPTKVCRFHSVTYELGCLRKREMVGRAGLDSECYCIICFLECHYSNYSKVFCFAKLWCHTDATTFRDSGEYVVFPLDDSVARRKWYRDPATSLVKLFI
jgi:hypothetical protein